MLEVLREFAVGMLNARESTISIVHKSKLSLKDMFVQCKCTVPILQEFVKYLKACLLAQWLDSNTIYY